MAEMAAAAWAAAKAAAGYIAASFKAVAAGTATAGQMATYAAVTVGVSVATTAVAQAMNKPNVGGRAPGEWVADPNAGIPFAIGSRIGVGGNMVYKNTFGKDNEYKSIVTVVSGAGPITGYLGFTADREAVTFSGENAVGRYADQMWMRRSLGNQPDAALIDPGLPGWGANYKLSGKAHFLWTLKQDSKWSVYQQGEPTPVHVVSGIKGYDPRYDSTHPGGSGDCRLGVRSTYRTIANPIIADLNWCLGLVENGKVVGGLGVSSAGIDWSAYVRAANVSDANGWSVAAYPRSDEPKTEVRIAFLQAGGAVISRKAGLVSCVSRGAPKTPVMTLTVADTAGPIEIDTAANVLNRLNTIVPRYLSETHNWQLVAAAPVSSSVYVAEDRGRVRSDQRDYPYVPSAKQAAELAALDVANSREGIAGRWPLKAHCRHLEPGDVFTVDEPGMLLDGMDFLVLHREIDPATTTVYVTFVSETAGKVEWALGRTANPPPTPSLAARHDLVAPGAPAWEVTLPTPVPGAVTVPSGTISIEIDNARAEDLIVEKGPSNTGPWSVIQNVKITDGELQVPINDLKPNEVFWIALSYRSVDEGTSARTIKGPYTASGLVAGDVIPTAPTIVAMQEAIDEADELLNDPTTGLKARSDAMWSDINTATTGLKDRTNALWTDVKTAGTGLLARMLAAETTEVNNNNAAVARLNGLEVSVNTAGTGLLARATSLEGRMATVETDKASVSQVSTLSSEINAARNGKASLAAELSSMRSATSDGLAGKANASDVTALQSSVNTPGTGLLSRATALEGRMTTVETNKAEASALSELSSRVSAAPISTIRPDATASAFVASGTGNPASLPSFTSGPNQSVVTVGNELGARSTPAIGESLYTAFRSVFPMQTGRVYELRVDYQASGTTTTSDGAQLGVRPVTSDGSSPAGSSTVRAPAHIGRGRNMLTARFVRGATVAGAVTVGAEFGIVRPFINGPLTTGTAAPTVSGYIGTVYSMEWVDITDEHLASARIGTLENTTANLETNKASASRVTTLETKVDTPGTGLLARMTTVESVSTEANGRSKAIKGLIQDVNGYISGYSSTNDGVNSTFEILAAAFAIRDPSSGEKIEYYDGNFHVFSPATNTRARYGKPFNSTQKLVWWTGPTSVAVGSETKANAYVYMSMNTTGGPRFGGSDAPGGGLQVSINRTRSFGSRSGAGSVTTQNIKVTVSGTSDPVTYRWWFVGGDASLAKGGPDDTEANWQTTLSASQSKTATWGVSVSTATESRSFLIEVIAQAL